MNTSKIIIGVLLLVFIFGCGAPVSTIRGEENEGKLVLLVTPNDAEVHLDGLSVGKAKDFATPEKALLLSRGLHKLMLQKSGYEAQEREVYLGAGSQQQVRINLKKR